MKNLNDLKEKWLGEFRRWWIEKKRESIKDGEYWPSAVEMGIIESILTQAITKSARAGFEAGVISAEKRAMCNDEGVVIYRYSNEHYKQFFGEKVSKCCDEEIEHGRCKKCKEHAE